MKAQDHMSLGSHGCVATDHFGQLRHDPSAGGGSGDSSGHLGRVVIQLYVLLYAHLQTLAMAILKSTLVLTPGFGTP